jgi:uncharacterized protein YchJ
MSCYISYKQNRIVVVDDGVEIFHPKRLSKHAISDFLTTQDWNEYLGRDVANWATQKKKWMPSKLADGQMDPAYSHISRNAKCPCGSGAKYKHCHGDENCHG